MTLLDLGPVQTSPQDAPGLRSSPQDAEGVAGGQVEAGLSSGHLGDATNAAAVVAAAAATTAPLIKVNLISDQFTEPDSGVTVVLIEVLL